jgi:hypothetical protein
MTPRRKILNDFAAATRDIELTEAAINILERVHDSRAVRSSINALKREQQAHLRRLDAAAAKLGAPYGVNLPDGAQQ